MPQEFLFSKTRIAPTPSGYLHAGNAFNFLLTAAWAKRSGAVLLLRIDDLDRERYRAAYAEDVFDTLRYLTIQWQEGPEDLADFEERWSQRWRMNLYEEALRRLREAGAVFACTCSRTGASECACRNKRLPLDAPDRSWRLITDDEPIMVQTPGSNAIVASLPAEMKNFIVRKKDGLPAYQLSSVVDDLHFGVDFIVRGRDLWPSTLAQQFLAKRLGEERFSSIAFYHHPLLTNAGGGKLSKSVGAASVKHRREQGKPLTDFLSHLGRLLGAPVSSSEDLLRAVVGL